MAKVVKANPLCGAIFVSVPAARRGAADYGVAYQPDVEVVFLRSEFQEASHEMAMSNAPVSPPSRAAKAKSSVLSV